MNNSLVLNSMILRKFPSVVLLFAVLFVFGCTKRARTDHNEVLHNGGKIIRPYYEIRKSRVLTLLCGLGLPTAAYFLGAGSGTNPVGGYIAAGLTGTVSLVGVPSALKNNIIYKSVTKDSNLNSWIRAYNRNNKEEYVIIPAKNFNGYCYLVPKQNLDQFLYDEEARIAQMKEEIREKNQRKWGVFFGIIAIGVAIKIVNGQNKRRGDSNNVSVRDCSKCGGDGIIAGGDEFGMQNICRAKGCRNGRITTEY